MNAAETLLNAIPLLVVTVLGGWLLNGRLTGSSEKSMDFRRGKSSVAWFSV